MSFAFHLFPRSGRMNFNKIFLNELIALRRNLHQKPELSDKENHSSEKLAKYVVSN
jgi:metal-dependent amidase/aminoacylase/carboxypeptidase family protein